MSETAIAVPVAPKKSYTRLILGGLFVLLLLVVYGAGIIALPLWVLSNYQGKNCDAVLKWNSVYTSIYPKFIQDKTLSAPINECHAYLQAGSIEKEGRWSESYDAYQAYIETYPSGLYVQEAHQRSAAALLSLVDDQMEQKNYEGALQNLTLITLSYSDTDSNEVAWGEFPSLYTVWGTGLRDAGDFEGAERVLSEFKIWSQRNLRPESETGANKELAQTYLAWALKLETQTKFEDALVKLDLAASIDPDAKFDSSAQVKAEQRNAYVGWGNDLLAHGEFPVAIKKFELAVSHSEGKNEDQVSDALANGYIQWAGDLSGDEDFLGALERLELARKAAVSDTAKKSVDTAEQDTYLAFSKSDGKQAQQAMQEALESACKKHKKPTLPIFGLNKDSIRVGFYGAEAKWPEALVAKTPGEMHYVACITSENNTVESRWHRQIVEYTSRGYYYYLIEQMRIQILWKIDLLNLKDLKSVAGQTFTGGTPSPFIESPTDGTRYFYGPLPSMTEIEQWLKLLIN